MFVAAVGSIHRISTDRSHVLLVNPRSAGGRTLKLLPDVESALARHGIRHRTVETRSLEHGIEEARRAAEADEIPVVMSGDGMVGAVGGELANSGRPMGIMPGGRGNDLARVLDIPSEPDGAAKVLAQGSEREIDVGEVNGKRFLCVASCGFDSDANRIANEAKLVRGNLVYLYAALRALVAWKPATFTLALDGEQVTSVGYSVAVANSKAYGGGMFIAPDADLADGQFDVVLTGSYGKLRALVYLPRVFNGTHVELDEVRVLRASEVRISADRDFAVYADGEHLTDLPATLRVLSRALRVIAPA